MLGWLIYQDLAIPVRPFRSLGKGAPVPGVRYLDTITGPDGKRRPYTDADYPLFLLSRLQSLPARVLLRVRSLVGGWWRRLLSSSPPSPRRVPPAAP
ncbi:MAG: hypothetical protein GX442_19020 [Candidatus Riflebacteria bacterium]|nr:hypothetical protein [Candidatus Riflebacteria bacterium]